MKLKIAVLGQCEVSFNEKHVPLKSKKGEAILAYVALSARGVVRRDLLKGLLWGDSEERKAQNNLRQTVWAIAKSFEQVGYTGFHSERSRIVLQMDTVEVDAIRILSQVGAGKPPNTLISNPHLLDTMMEGFEDISSEYGQWVTSVSEQYRSTLLRELDRSLVPGRLDQHSLNLAQIRHTLDPLNELACQIIMESKAASGDTAAALAVYQKLCREMDAHQGMEPSSQTQDLVVSIKTGDLDSGNVLRASNSLSISRPRIVLPEFEVSSADAKQKRLINGFRHEFLASLIKFKEWQVIDGRHYDASKQQNDPGVPSSYSLEISVIFLNSSLKLILTLKEMDTSNYVWGDKIEDSIENYLTSQVDIIRRIAAALNLKISLERLAVFSAQDVQPLDAFDRWLVAEELILSMNQNSWQKAEYILTDLIADYETFARAHSALAQMENSRQLSFPGVTSTEDRREIALIHARRSVALDANDSRNQLCLGWARAMDGQFSGAEMAFAKAHSLNENDPWTLISAAMGLSFCGNKCEAFRLSNEAASLTVEPGPMYWSFQAAIAFLDDNMTACVELSELCNEITADVLAWHTAALALSGRVSEAKDLKERFVIVSRELWQMSECPTESKIATWLLSSFPIKNVESWEKLRDGLEISGLNTSGVNPPA